MLYCTVLSCTRQPPEEWTSVLPLLLTLCFASLLLSPCWLGCSANPPRENQAKKILKAETIVTALQKMVIIYRQTDASRVLCCCCTAHVKNRTSLQESRRYTQRSQTTDRPFVASGTDTNQTQHLVQRPWHQPLNKNNEEI